ncbi:MAG: 2-phospho-L-lactate transferase [Verrucomicrobiaceae bacterium]|nr:2-phospho-L-lactate transferase [Verrucomicrobiaceae bacterium]
MPNSVTQPRRYLALSGGVGGAKLALGLSKQLTAEELIIVCNTGDDFDHYGLRICPDLDTVMYTLAGRNNQQQGWGLADESWRTMDALAELGGETWFRLGDLDIATHLQRGELLRRGLSLSAITQTLCRQLGVDYRVLPMSDEAVRTVVSTDQGQLSFQHYFVREQCRPEVRGFEFRGIDDAHPQREFLELLRCEELDAVIICPSNPFVSIDPILQLPGVRAALVDCSAPVIAVSPIVGGQAIKGPAAKMLRELNLQSSAFAVAQHYSDILDGFIIDTADADQAGAITELNIVVHTTPSIMTTLDDRIRLATETLRFAATLGGDV